MNWKLFLPELIIVHVVASCGGEVFTLGPKRVSTLNVSGSFSQGALWVILDAGCWDPT